MLLFVLHGRKVHLLQVTNPQGGKRGATILSQQK